MGLISCCPCPTPNTDSVSIMGSGTKRQLTVMVAVALSAGSLGLVTSTFQLPQEEAPVNFPTKLNPVVCPGLTDNSLASDSNPSGPNSLAVNLLAELTPGA